MAALRGFLFDIDGTLLDSNEAHARAWAQALAEMGMPVELERIRPLIGMGSDKVVPLLTGLAPDDPRAQLLAERRGEIFRTVYLPTLKPFPRVREVLEELGRRHVLRMTATSASEEDQRALLERAGVADLMDAMVSKDDVDRSKPAPDIVAVALEKARLDPPETLFVGDTPYDVAAARRAGVQAVAVRSGGWAAEDLRGALAIFDDVAALYAQLDHLFVQWR